MCADKLHVCLEMQVLLNNEKLLQIVKLESNYTIPFSTLGEDEKKCSKFKTFALFLK